MVSIVTKSAVAAAALAFPAVLFGAGIAQADNLNVRATPQITDQGVWIGWDGGSGATWCTTTTDWGTQRSYQDVRGTGGVLMASFPLWRASDFHITCDNGDAGFVGGVVY